MTIIRIISREEIFQIILNSNNKDRIRKYIQAVKLTKEEESLIREKYDDFYTNAYIDYYQYNIEDAFNTEKLILNKKSLKK